MQSTEYLTSEIKRLQKKIVFNYTVMGILSLLVVVYAVLGLWILGNLTDPVELSDYAIYKTKVAGPVAVKNLEALLEQKAPELAEGLSDTIQKVIPEIRYKAQAALTLMIAKNFKEMETGLIDMTNAWMEAHADKIRPKKTTETVRQYADRIVDALVTDFGENMNDHMIKTLGLTVSDLRDRSELLLIGLEGHLNKLNTTPDNKLERSQQLERFLIGYIVNSYLNELPVSR